MRHAVANYRAFTCQFTTKRRFLPNLQKKRIFVPELNDWVEVKLCAKALRTVSKHGLFDYVKKLQKKGLDIGFELEEEPGC